MVKKSLIETSIVESIVAQAKIKYFDSKAENKADFLVPSAVVEELLNQISILNRDINRDTRFIEGINVEDIEIVEELAYLITPLIISNNPQDRFFADLRFDFEDESLKDRKFDYSKFMDYQHAFRKFFKKNCQSGMVSIMTKKTLMSFDEVKDKVCLVYRDAKPDNIDEKELESLNDDAKFSCKWNRPSSRSEAFWPYFVNADMVQYQLDLNLYECEFTKTDIDVWVKEHPFDGLGGNNSSYSTVTK